MKVLFGLFVLTLLALPSFAQSVSGGPQSLIIDTVFTVTVNYDLSPKEMAKKHHLDLVNDSVIVSDFSDSGQKQVQICLASLKFHEPVKSFDSLADLENSFDYRAANLPEVLAISALYSRRIQLTRGIMVFRQKFWIGLFGPNVFIYSGLTNKRILLMSMESSRGPGYISTLIVHK